MSRRFSMLVLAGACFLGGWAAGQLPLPKAWGWQAPEVKDPKYLHAMNVQVRMANEPRFTDSTMQYNIEVYRDENNGNLIYICETGDISIVPAKP